MDWLRCSLVVALTGALGCGNESGGDTDTDTDATTPTTTPESTDTFDPPDTFPDTFDADSDPTDDPSGPTFTDSDPTDDSSSPTFTDSNTDSNGASTTDAATDTDVATDTDDPTDTDTDTDDPTGGLPDAGSCCQAQDPGQALGCDDETVTGCVCARDPFCCDSHWDEACVVAVVIHGCGTCESVGGDGDCCAANDTPGCDDDAIEACVCEADSQCCLQPWDETCALGVEFENCGRCP